MIKATLIKSVPLKDGTITYIFSGQGGDKAARHAAVDLEGTECAIQAAQPDIPEVGSDFKMIMADFDSAMRNLVAWVEGRNEKEEGHE